MWLWQLSVSIILTKTNRPVNQTHREPRDLLHESLHESVRSTLASDAQCIAASQVTSESLSHYGRAQHYQDRDLIATMIVSVSWVPDAASSAIYSCQLRLLCRDVP